MMSPDEQELREEVEDQARLILKLAEEIAHLKPKAEKYDKLLRDRIAGARALGIDEEVLLELGNASEKLAASLWLETIKKAEYWDQYATPHGLDVEQMLKDIYPEAWDKIKEAS